VIIAKIVLWTLTVVQIGMLIFVVSLGVRMFLAERRRKMQESVDRAVARWSDEVKPPSTINPPPSYSTNYLLQEGFLRLVRYPDERLVLRAEDTGIINHFHIGFDANTGQARIHNEATNEVVPVTDEFISRWSVNEA
jgi:hypothetical protein